MHVLLQSADATVVLWNVIANLFVKAHDDTLTEKLLDSLLSLSLSPASLLVDMTIVSPDEFLRYDVTVSFSRTTPPSSCLPITIILIISHLTSDLRSLDLVHTIMNNTVVVLFPSLYVYVYSMDRNRTARPHVLPLYPLTTSMEHFSLLFIFMFLYSSVIPANRHISVPDAAKATVHFVIRLQHKPWLCGYYAGPAVPDPCEFLLNIPKLKFKNTKAYLMCHSW